MNIFEELNSVDKKMKDDLDELEIRRKELEKRKKEEIKKAKEEKVRRKNNKKEILKSILEDNTEGIDEPHIYVITYEHSRGGGYGYGPCVEQGISKFEKLMTERERKIATVTGKIKKIIDASLPDYGCHCTGIVNIEKVGREVTCDEKIKLDAVRKKVNIIKNNKDAGKKCTINLYDEEFEDIQVNTSLKYALLSTLNIENGKVENMEDKIIADAMPAPVTKNEPNPEITTQTGKEDKRTVESKQKTKSKITMQDIRKAIRIALSRGER